MFTRIDSAEYNSLVNNLNDAIKRKKELEAEVEALKAKVKAYEEKEQKNISES